MDTFINGKNQTSKSECHSVAKGADKHPRDCEGETCQATGCKGDQRSESALRTEACASGHSVGPNQDSFFLGRRADELRRQYRIFNRKYFNNELPDDAEIVWEALGKKLMGYQQEDKIALSDEYAYASTLWKLTLLHEMCHLKLPKTCKHGPRFQDEMRRLANEGAMDGLW